MQKKCAFSHKHEFAWKKTLHSLTKHWHSLAKLLHSPKKLCVCWKTFAISLKTMLFFWETWCSLAKLLCLPEKLCVYLQKIWVLSQNCCIYLRNYAFTCETAFSLSTVFPEDIVFTCKTLVFSCKTSLTKLLFPEKLWKTFAFSLKRSRLPEKFCVHLQKISILT